MKKLSAIAMLFFAAMIFQYCSKKDSTTLTTPGSTTVVQPTLPIVPFAYNISYPAYIQASLVDNDNTVPGNGITDNGATLGRVLFYDRQLSKNNTISCGSCHKQQFSFDDNIAKSKGFEGGFTDRNSMAILNIRFYKSGKMFWDERSATVEKQALQPIQNHTEMGLTLAELETKVRALNYYPVLFQNAFGSSVIDSNKIANALAQFERSIVTYQSKYDKVKQGLDNFTTAEALGETVFNAAPPPPPGGGTPPSCASCHTPPMFINSQAPPFAFPDPTDLGINNQNRFKSGSLRNVGTRIALFHNGSIANLQAMLTAGAPGSGTSPIPAHSVAPQDVQNLLAFLNTLTDNTVITEVKFSDPFR